MKKAMILILSVLVVLGLSVSCDQPKTTSNEPTRMVQFNDGNVMTKALNRAPEGLNTEGLWWSYTAEKLDNSGFTTGETSAKVAVGEKGLTAPVGPFSQGEWKFTLYGYVDDARTRLAWTGSTSTTLTVRNGVSTPASVSVDVHRLRTPGVNGIIRVPVDMKVQDNAHQEIGTDYKLDVKIYKGGELLSFTDHASGDYSVESGLYKVVVSAVNADGSIEYASNEIAVNVYDNLVTTVGGVLDERTLETRFTTNEKGETVATSPSTAISSNADTVIKVESTPAEVHATAAEATTVSIPQGAVTGSNASLSVTPYGVESANSNPDFTVAANEAVIGGIDLVLSVDDNKTTEFNSPVTVTTYIAKGLDPQTIGVKYSGAGEQPVFKSYEAATGKLEFTTTHFSRFYVVSTEVEALNVTQNIYYTKLSDIGFGGKSANMYNSGDEILLLKDATLTPAEGSGYSDLFIIKSMTLDLGGHILTSETTIVPYDAFRVGNGTINSVDHDIFDLNNGHLIVENGNYNIKNTDPNVAHALVMVSYGTTDMKPAVVEVFDGNFVAEGCPIFQTHGNDKALNRFTINGGSFNGMLSYFPSDGRIEINGGSFVGRPNTVLLYQKAADMIINGGEFNTTWDQTFTADWSHNGSGCADETPAVIAIEACGYPGGTPCVSYISDQVVFHTDNTSNSPVYDILVIDWRENDSHNYFRSNTKDINKPFRYAEITSKTKETVAINDAISIDVDTTWYNALSSEFSISTAAQLAGLSKLVSEGITFEGKTVNLIADIDLAGIAWKPIGSVYRKGASYDDFTYSNAVYPGGKAEIFKGSFNGNNHIISNLTPQNPSADDTVTGLFGLVGGNGSIKNLTVESGKVVNGALADGVIGDTAAGVVGMILTDVGEEYTLEKCNAGSDLTVESYSKTNGTTASGVVGRIYGKGSVNVLGCSNAATVNGMNSTQSKAAGIVGIVGSDTNVNIDKAADGTLCQNTGAITSSQDAGGILCWNSGTSTIANSRNTGAITVNSVGSVQGGNGGIAGNMNYSPAKLTIMNTCESTGVQTGTNCIINPMLGTYSGGSTYVEPVKQN